MIEALKIKVKSLSSEASYIRAQEEKQLRIADFESQSGLKRGSGHFRHQKDDPRPKPGLRTRKGQIIDYPEVKEGSQERYDDAFMKFWNLHSHRTNTLRKEARITHLAYGFLRGIPYSRMETQTHDTLDAFEDQRKNDEGFKERRLLDRVKACAKKFSEVDPREFNQRWAEWFDKAKEHLKEQVH